MKDKGVKVISKERLNSVYGALKDLESRSFESENEAICACRTHIDELVSQRYLAFMPKTQERVFGR